VSPLTAPIPVALIGPFDVPSLSLQLLRRAVEEALRDRCPEVALRVFAPEAGVPGLDPVEAFDADDAGRLHTFRRTFAHVLVAGDGRVTAAWTAPAQHVVAVHGEAGFLARRSSPDAVLAARREFLVAMGWWPEEGSVAVVQRAPGTQIAVPADHVVELGAEPGDRGDAAEGQRCISLRAGASVDDVVTAIALADVVVAQAASVRAVAAAFERELVLEGDDAATAVRALDADFDELCRTLTGHEPAPFAASEVEALRRALDARGRRLAAERAAMADRVWAIERHLEGELAARDARIAQLEAERDALLGHVEVRARAAAAKAIRRLTRRSGPEAGPNA
jgi:hypothetical protein